MNAARNGHHNGEQYDNRQWDFERFDAERQANVCALLADAVVHQLIGRPQLAVVLENAVPKIGAVLVRSRFQLQAIVGEVDVGEMLGTERWILDRIVVWRRITASGAIAILTLYDGVSALAR